MQICYTKKTRVYINFMMSNKTALHIFVLFAGVAATFLWVTTPLLSNYSLQLTALLIISLILGKRLMDEETFRIIEGLTTVVATLIVVSETGGISSPLFFLNYFLLFALSLLLEPAIPVALAFIFIGYYLLTSESGTSVFQLLELLAFPFITPLAYFAGKIYQKEENQKKEIANLRHKVEELKEELVEEELGSKKITT